MKNRTRASLTSLLSVAGMALSLLTVEPASAGTCTTPYCGGVVRVLSDAGDSIAITNCWTSGGFTYGDSQACMTNGWHNTKYNAGKYLASGETSASYYYYYDVDGFRVFRGCEVRGYWDGGSPFTYYRSPSQSSMWVRITGTWQAVITKIHCN